jgi:signal transduction histidine kinase/CheY-like chemotaxis protein/CHASE3 domain sensor protein
MKPTSFKRNILIGFGVSLLLLIISSVASYTSIRNLLNSSGQVNNTNLLIKELESILSALKDAETGQRGFLLTGEERYLEPYRGAYERAVQSFTAAKDLSAGDQAQAANFAKLREMIDKRMGALSALITMRRQNFSVSGSDLDKGKEHMDEIRALVKIMEDKELNVLKTRTDNLNQFTSYTPILIIVTALLSIALTIVFFGRVSNDFDKKAKLQKELEEKDADISRRISIIQDVAEKISAGDYSVRTDDKGSDGLGSVSGSLNKMAASLDYSFATLSDKEWLQAGIAGLNDKMLGEKTLSILSRTIIEYVAGYSGSQVGALYLLEDDQSLYLSAGFTLPGNRLKEKIAIGEGLAGQVAASGKEILITDILPDDISISIATGEIKPRTVIAVPIFYNNTVTGVVELASAKEYTANDKAFFQAVSHNTGIVINSAYNRARMQELLEETQSQAEELQAQHREMENINAELEVQAEKLQTSEEELKVQQEELLQSNQELEERTRLLEERNELIIERNLEIQSKAEELELTTRYKSEFLANMSHELRTPLNSILLLSRLMSENTDKNLTDEQVEYARVIQSSGHGLLSLIDEILDLSKIESGKMELEYGQVSVQEIINDLNSMFVPMAGEKNLEFRVNKHSAVPEKIETDKLRLEQIIKNLISNALKFTAKGLVSLDIAVPSSKPGYISFSVKDTGIGIPEEKQQLIFDAFQQADGSTRRKYGGTGLGLSISRELAKLLGAEIELKSEVDKGSNFTVYLPLKKPSHKSLAADPVKEEKYLLADQPIESQESVQKAEKIRYISNIIPPDIPDDRNNIVPEDRIILIIEDDTNFAKSLLDYTRQKGYKGIVSVRGDQGIELANTFKPIGILLDIQLPVKDGWQVMEELKSNPATKHIPVHIMSSYEVKNKSLSQGAVDFINKPFAYEKMQEVFQKIEYVLNRNVKKVMIVEENSKHAKALAYFLETFNVNSEIKNNVSDSIEALNRKEVDCVILDMGIPDQKSYDTLEEVKKTPGLENVPIIIFTGKSLSKAEEFKIKQYADSIVIKTAHSYRRILDEVSLFLHLVEENTKPEKASGQYKKLGALADVLKDKKVLIADDDVRNIFSLTKALENFKMQVISAIDGKEALKQLKENPDIDIVLMDMMMPEMDGYETTKRIRENSKYRNLAIIAVTAKAMTGDREKCINAGASDYITKPVDIDQLLSLLRVWLYDKGE